MYKGGSLHKNSLYDQYDLSNLYPTDTRSLHDQSDDPCSVCYPDQHDCYPTDTGLYTIASRSLPDRTSCSYCPDSGRRVSHCLTQISRRLYCIRRLTRLLTSSASSSVTASLSLWIISHLVHSCNCSISMT